MTDDEQTPRGKAYDRNDNMRTPAEGQSPRPASEPKGSEGSSTGSKTATDPATGAPNKKREP